MNETPDLDLSDLVAEALTVEALAETNNPGFTTIFCAGTAGTASCPTLTASTAASWG